jgi:hypothetical protein
VRILGKPAGFVLFEVLSRVTIPLATKIYQRLYSVAKTYIYHERIYPMRRTWSERLRDFAEATRLDVFKQFQKQSIKEEQNPARFCGTIDQGRHWADLLLCETVLHVGNSNMFSRPWLLVT